MNDLELLIEKSLTNGARQRLKIYGPDHIEQLLEDMRGVARMAEAMNLTFRGGEKELKLINEYWEAIGKPKYNPRKSVQENLTDLKKYMGYWPEPMDCDKVVQTTLLEYEEDDEESNEAIQDYFKMQQDFQLKQEEPKKRKKNYKKDWDDDDVPF